MEQEQEQEQEQQQEQEQEQQQGRQHAAAAAASTAAAEAAADAAADAACMAEDATLAAARAHDRFTLVRLVLLRLHLWRAATAPPAGRQRASARVPG